MSSDRLHALIRSMTGSEKRYFKRMAQSHTVSGKNNFIVLFDAIESQKEYDEKELKVRLKDKALRKHLAPKKVHLFELILRSMHGFHHGMNPRVKLAEGLKSLSILYEKGLYSSCRKLVSRLLELADQYDKFETILELLEWNRKLVFAQPMDTAWELANIRMKKEQAILKLNQYQTLQGILDEIQQYNLTQGSFRKKDLLIDLRKKLGSPLLRAEDKAGSFLGSITHARVWSSWYALSEELEKSLRSRQRVITLFHGKPERIPDEPDIYLSMFNNMLIIAAQLKKRQILEEGISTLEEIARGKFGLSLLYRIRASEIALLFSIDLVQERPSRATLHDLDKKLNALLEWGGEHLRVQRKMLLHIQFAILQFKAKEFNRALQYLNVPQHDRTWEKSEDARLIMRMLNLIIHFELGHEDLLEYLVKSDERFYVKRSRMYAFEAAMLKAFKKLSADPSPASQKKVFVELYPVLKNIAADPHEGSPMLDFDYLGWVKFKGGISE